MKVSSEQFINSMFGRPSRGKILTKGVVSKDSKCFTQSFQHKIHEEMPKRSSQWVNRLTQKPLLQIIAAEIDQKQQIATNPIDLNCYDRLKKIFKKSEEQSQKNLEQEKIFEDVIKIENHLNSMEKKYRRVYKDRNLSCKLSHQTLSKSKAVRQSKHVDRNSIEGEKIGRNKDENFNQLLKNVIPKMSVKEQIQNLKQECKAKFINNKKTIHDNVFKEVEDYIENTLKNKLNLIVIEKLSQYEKIKQKNDLFNKLLRQKQLQIQSLKKQNNIKQGKLNNRLISNQQSMLNRSKLQAFYDEYQLQFGKIAIKELKKKFDAFQSVFLTNFSKAEHRHLQNFSKFNQEKQKTIKELKDKIKGYEEKEVQLNGLILRKQKLEQLDNSKQTHEIYNKIIEYQKSFLELQRLQRFILDKYVEWNSSKDQQQAKIIKMTSESNVNYEEMIENIVYFHINHAGQDKNIEYLAKIMGQIQKIKKIMGIAKPHEKLQPLKTLEDIQNFIKKVKKKHRAQESTIKNISATNYFSNF